MTDDKRPFDRALFLHERQAPPDDHDPDDDDSALVIATATAKRQNKTALRASQGDRVDWKQGLVNAPGYRNIPNAKLPFRTKQARTSSIKAAADRREKRRELGVAIHYDQFAWSRLGQAKRDQFDLVRKSLAWIGPRWDANRDFGRYDDGRDGGQHLDHLFRFGTAKAHPRTPLIQHMREGM
ncbi:conserved hypothetical protein [Mesorhizobium ventifaucium]|uniref:Uncharacterized protein n=1 Tax=Mesorhizobium ventifaucium TaxID=666020 RepID=A0ABM9DD93_9HYPH|nr:hypothetical protein [Mesorhizobium ventifaucium]CAH2394515.1 conserved hypothetical protein [Mesorhizobium ventifaucium]